MLTYAHETPVVSELAKKGNILAWWKNSRRNSQGETFAEAKANLLDALKLGLEGRRNLVEKDLSPEAVRESIELADT